MIELSDLINLTGPLLTVGSISFGAAVYLFENDEIGSKAYNSIILSAAVTILTALLAVWGFASDVLFNPHEPTLLPLILLLSGLSGFVAALIAAVGVGLQDVPFKEQEQ